MRTLALGAIHIVRTLALGATHIVRALALGATHIVRALVLGATHIVRAHSRREGGFDEKRMVSCGEGGRIIILCVRLFSYPSLFSTSLESWVL